MKHCKYLHGSKITPQQRKAWEEMEEFSGRKKLKTARNRPKTHIVTCRWFASAHDQSPPYLQYDGASWNFDSGTPSVC